MKSRNTIRAARILAFAAMFVATLGIHLLHPLVHSSGHQFNDHQNDSAAHKCAEAGASDHHHGDDPSGQTALQARGGAMLNGSCPVCEFLKIRPVQSCFEPADHQEVYLPPSAPVVRTDTLIDRYHPLPRHSRAPPAVSATHIV